MKLIQEPPLLVLPSLVRELGMSEAILVQQLFFVGQQRGEDGWVQRSVPDWHRALRQTLSTRTIERAFAKLLDRGWVEAEQQIGQATRYRVTPAKVADGGPATVAAQPPPKRRGTVSREEAERGTTSKSPSSMDEPEGFAEWAKYHSEKSGYSVPKVGTTSRRELARSFAAIVAEGYELEDFKLVTDALLASDWHAAGGYTKHKNALVKKNMAERVDDGRRARAQRDVGGKYDHLDDD